MLALLIPLTLALSMNGQAPASQTGAGGGSPDLIAIRIGADRGDFRFLGQSAGLSAYSMGVAACNIGDMRVSWSSSTSGHPIAGQQVYRLSQDGRRFEQLGLAWVLHEFCALNEAHCGTCSATDCSTLGVGCASTHSASILAPPFLGARYEIDIVHGTNPAPEVTLSQPGDSPFDSALTLQTAELDIAGARFFFELQYAAADDSTAGNHANNCSYREVGFIAGGSNVIGIGATVRELPALSAWSLANPDVEVMAALVTDEGGPGVHGIFNLGTLVTDNGDGTWTYEYALHNQTSSRAGGSFSVPLPVGVTITGAGFHDIDHRGPGTQPGTDWASSSEGPGGAMSFATGDNPLSWGTLYNFRFTADTPPVDASASIGLFESGMPGSISVATRGPGAPSDSGSLGTAFCFGDGSGNACPCGNAGGSGEGCATSTGSGMTLSAAGSSSLASDDLVLTANGVPVLNTGIFYAGKSPFAGNPLFDGLQCTGGDTLRFRGQLAATTTVSDSGLVAQDVFGLFWSAGTTVHFQYFTRDNQTGASPCSGFANLSHGLSVVMTP